MPMKTCERCQAKYDTDKSLSCPYCGVRLQVPIPDTTNRDLHEPGPPGPARKPSDIEVPGARPVPHEYGRETRYAGIPGAKGDEVLVEGFRPVCGWLVCTEGPDRGRDYRIFPERNFVGRREDQHIPILNDETVTREQHAVVIFDPRNREFRILPKNGSVFHNGQDLRGEAKLTAYDEVLIGNTKLRFVPFCGERFQWE